MSKTDEGFEARLEQPTEREGVHFTAHRMVGANRYSPADDYEFHGTWHRAGCDANCDVPFGCAAQWHPEEVERMKAAGQARRPTAAVVTEELRRSMARDRLLSEDIVTDAGKQKQPYQPKSKCICPGDGSRGIKMNCAVHGIELSDPPKPPLRDRTSAERKAEPIHCGVMLYFPDALAAVARLSKAGNDKHNPGQPLHWSRGKSNDHMDCIARHILTPDHVDETGETELVAAAWRALAALQLQQEKRLVAAGIMPHSGVTE